MQYQTRSDGKRIYPADIKSQVLTEFEAGVSAAELSRKFAIPIQRILKWNRLKKNSANENYSQAKP